MKKIKHFIVITLIFVCTIIPAGVFAESTSTENTTGSEVITTKVMNFQAEGYSYKSIKLSWDKVDGAEKYVIKRVILC